MHRTSGDSVGDGVPDVPRGKTRQAGCRGRQPLQTRTALPAMRKTPSPRGEGGRAQRGRMRWKKGRRWTPHQSPAATASPQGEGLDEGSLMSAAKKQPTGSGRDAFGWRGRPGKRIWSRRTTAQPLSGCGMERGKKTTNRKRQGRFRLERRRAGAETEPVAGGTAFGELRRGASVLRRKRRQPKLPPHPAMPCQPNYNLHDRQVGRLSAVLPLPTSNPALRPGREACDPPRKSGVPYK